MPTVDLPETEWQKVLGLIAQGPWVQANPLLMAIGNQLRQQAGTGATQPNGPFEGEMDLKPPEGRQRPS